MRLLIKKGDTFVTQSIEMKFLAIFALIFLVFGISFIMINLRQVVTGEDFRGSCASNNPMLKTKIGDCSVCGKKGDEVCQMPEVKSA